MTEVPNAGPDAGSDSIPENPALAGGVFRSGVDFADVAVAGRFEEIASMIESGDDSIGAGAGDDREAAEPVLRAGDLGRQGRGGQRAAIRAGQ